MTLMPVTPVVIVAIEMAASDVVERCPRVKTDTKTREYSRIWELQESRRGLSSSLDIAERRLDELIERTQIRESQIPQ